MPAERKDEKILWAYGGGRCAMPSCRKLLVMKQPGTKRNASGATVLGEACHIRGENPGSARHDPGYPNVNRYPNLILLCEEHHTIIDDNEAEWTVGRVEEIKRDHEAWIHGLVPGGAEEANRRYYHGLVEQLVSDMSLRRWPDISDSFIRNVVPKWFVDGVRNSTLVVHGAVWPGTIPELEGHLLNVVDRATTLVNAFLEKTDLLRTAFRPPASQHFDSYMDYMKFCDTLPEWEDRVNRYLFNLTHALNLLADCVRRSLDPEFFREAGHFTVVDALGAMSELEGRVYFVNGYHEDGP